MVDSGISDGFMQEFVELYDKYNNKGLEVIAFPCNQFGEFRCVGLWPQALEHSLNQEG